MWKYIRISFSICIWIIIIFVLINGVYFYSSYIILIYGEWHCFKFAGIIIEKKFKSNSDFQLSITYKRLKISLKDQIRHYFLKCALSLQQKEKRYRISWYLNNNIWEFCKFMNKNDFMIVSEISKFVFQNSITT